MLISGSFLFPLFRFLLWFCLTKKTWSCWYSSSSSQTSRVDIKPKTTNITGSSQSLYETVQSNQINRFFFELWIKSKHPININIGFNVLVINKWEKNIINSNVFSSKEKNIQQVCRSNKILYDVRVAIYRLIIGQFICFFLFEFLKNFDNKKM